MSKSKKRRSASSAKAALPNEVPRGDKSSSSSAVGPVRDYALLVALGREAAQRMGDSLWEIGDLALEVETTYGESDLQRFADDIDVPFKTVQGARTTARRWPEKPKRLGFSICQQLNAQIDRFKLLRDNPDMTYAQARKIAQTRADVGRKARSQIRQMWGAAMRRLGILLPDIKNMIDLEDEIPSLSEDEIEQLDDVLKGGIDLMTDLRSVLDSKEIDAEAAEAEEAEDVTMSGGSA